MQVVNSFPHVTNGFTIIPDRDFIFTKGFNALVRECWREVGVLGDIKPNIALWNAAVDSGAATTYRIDKDGFPCGYLLISVGSFIVFNTNYISIDGIFVTKRARPFGLNGVIDDLVRAYGDFDICFNIPNNPRLANYLKRRGFVVADTKLIRRA